MKSHWLAKVTINVIIISFRNTATWKALAFIVCSFGADSFFYLAAHGSRCFPVLVLKLEWKTFERHLKFWIMIKIWVCSSSVGCNINKITLILIITSCLKDKTLILRLSISEISQINTIIKFSIFSFKCN